MQLMNIEWKWNIPNLLSLLRILLVPVFVILYRSAATSGWI